MLSNWIWILRLQRDLRNQRLIYHLRLIPIWNGILSLNFFLVLTRGPLVHLKIMRNGIWAMCYMSDILLDGTTVIVRNVETTRFYAGHTLLLLTRRLEYLLNHMIWPIVRAKLIWLLLMTSCPHANTTSGVDYSFIKIKFIYSNLRCICWCFND
jgi:hypothetical protein